jgi:hypothetical protein
MRFCDLVCFNVVVHMSTTDRKTKGNNVKFVREANFGGFIDASFIRLRVLCAGHKY